LQIILKEQVHRIYRKITKNRASKRVAQISAAPINICNLSTSKMGKTWHFIFATVDTLQKTFFLQQGHKNKTQIKLLSSKSNEKKTKKK
jgi:hypothetical protein